MPYIIALYDIKYDALNVPILDIRFEYKMLSWLQYNLDNDIYLKNIEYIISDNH